MLLQTKGGKKKKEREEKKKNPDVYSFPIINSLFVISKPPLVQCLQLICK